MASNIERSKEFFEKLSVENLQTVDSFYDKAVHFQDPVHRLDGRQALTDYYKNLYSNVTSIRFEFGAASEAGNIVSLEWTMYLKTPSISKGEEFTVDGVSIIEFGGPEGKAIKHRDYFDMGEFVYERVPILRSVIRYIKNRLAGK